ncbi:MAG: glycosyl hydrolase family 18 protein [Saccharofermentanales bacterium]
MAAKETGSDINAEEGKSPSIRIPDMSAYGGGPRPPQPAPAVPSMPRRDHPGSRKRSRRRKRSRIFIIAAAVIMLLLWGSAIFWYFYPSTLWSDQEPAGLIINGDTFAEEDFREVDGNLFIRYDVANAAIDSTLFYEPETSRVILTTDDKIIAMRTDLLTTYVNYKPVAIDVPIYIDNETPYISVDFLTPVYDLSVERYDNGVFNVSDGRRPVLVVEAIRHSYLREAPRFRSSRISELAAGEMLYVYEEVDGWYRVRSGSGIIAYVDKREVKLDRIIEAKVDVDTSTPPWQPVGGKINLTWDYMSRARQDMSGYTAMPGLNVISPTWFHVDDEEGGIKSFGSNAYVEWAHGQGLQVWALLDNSFDPDITRAVIRDYDKRYKVISQILILAELLDIDGINIDFEDVYYEDSGYLTQFVRELTIMLHEQDLTVSMDVTVRSTNPNWSMVFDRPALAEVLDYMAVMTYDEHWSSSPEAGSVASLPWVRTSLERILEQIPPQKLLLGVPFYTRLWEEIPQDDGSVKVSSKAYSMNGIRKILEENGAAAVFDVATGQHYATYTKDGNVYKTWLEDGTSMRQRIGILREYGLAGVASWRRGFEDVAIWNIIKDELESRP